MKSIAAAAFILALGVGGCRRHVHHVHHPPDPRPDGTVVVVREGHVHSDRCGHFFHGGRWYVLRGHRHHHGCGHVRRGGRWVLVVR